jgi:hypothetical protein
MTNANTTGSEMAKALYGDLLAMGATPAQAKRALFRAFARLALTVRPSAISASVEARALSIASGEEF